MGLLLRRGAEANARDKFWQTPLHVAAANRATRCAEALLTQLSNLNMADRTGRTALHHAAQSGFQEVRLQPLTLPYLLKQKYNKIIIMEGFFVFQMVKLLLNKGANLSAIDKKERQPIHCAAYLGEQFVSSSALQGPRVSTASTHQNMCAKFHAHVRCIQTNV